MSSIQAYKAHKQEGKLVSKVHKQGALGTSSQASLHQWLHDNCRIIMLINSRLQQIEKKLLGC